MLFYNYILTNLFFFEKFLLVYLLLPKGINRKDRTVQPDLFDLLKKEIRGYLFQILILTTRHP